MERTRAWLIALKPPIITAVEVIGVVAASELGRPVTAATAAVVPTGAAGTLCLWVAAFVAILLLALDGAPQADRGIVAMELELRECCGCPIGCSSEDV
mmetsp:Transcript_15012/g.40551  ORF Transcript_15012/g.40551 Transcript_15012/m.40551 type:complete len:98 (+) Transcript_15012:704-997(+)